MKTRRTFIAQVAICTALAPAASVVHAQDGFPQRPITLYVTFGPGSGPDTLARTIAPEISKHLGQSFVIENRPAAGGNVAAQQLLQQRPDGYTLILATDSLLTMNPHLLPKTSFDPLTDLVAVAPIAEAAVFLTVNPSLGVNNVGELVELVKANPNKYTYFAPTGTPHHLLAERFTAHHKLNWVRVSYREPQQAHTEMLSGLVPVGFTSYPQVSGSVQTGKLKLLAVGSSSRLESHSALPTLNESVPGLEESTWFALYAPKGTPPAVIAALNSAVVKAREAADVKQRLDQFGMRQLALDNEAFGERVRKDYQRRGEVIRARGIRVD